MQRAIWKNSVAGGLARILWCTLMFLSVTSCGKDQTAPLQRRAEELGELLIAISSLSENEATEKLEDFINQLTSYFFHRHPGLKIEFIPCSTTLQRKF